MVDRARAKGEIRKEIDNDMFLQLLVHIQMAVNDCIGISDSREKFTEENLERLSQMAVSVLLHGGAVGGG